MSYTKQNFVDGQVLKAEHLNHIEAAISQIDATPKNLADGWVWKTGYWDNATGEAKAHDAFQYSENYVPVKAGEKYTILDYTDDHPGWLGVHHRGKFTDDAGAFIVGITHGESYGLNAGGDGYSYEVTVPDGATRMYIHVVSLSGKSGIKLRIYDSGATSQNLAVGLTWKSGYYYSEDGSLVPDVSPLWCTENYIPVTAGEKYTIKNYTTFYSDYAGFGSRGKFTDDAGNFLGALATNDGDAYSYNVIVPSGATRLYLNVVYNSVSDITLEVYRTVDTDSPESIMCKRWVSFGDSITERESWQPYLYKKFGLIHINCGIGSTCLAGQGRAGLSPFWSDDRLSAVKSANPDIITILGGANDLGYESVTIGDDNQFSLSIGAKDKNTFIGAYSYIIENLLTWKPKLKIVILGTTWAHNDGADYSNRVTFTDFSNASRKVAEYYGLPFVDLHGKCGFNKFTMGDSPFNVYSDDHIHPNDEGGKVIAACVDEVFCRLFSF